MAKQLSPWAEEAIEHWRKYRPKLYAQLFRSGQLHERAEKAAQQTNKEQGVSGRDNERDVAARELGSREGETPLSAKRRGRSKPGREPGQLSGSNQSGNDYRTTEADQIEKAAHRGNTLRNAQWRSQPTKTGEDGYGDAGVSRDTGDWSNDLASQGYSVPEVPWRVLKLPQRLFEVGEWIDLIGVALRSIR